MRGDRQTKEAMEGKMDGKRKKKKAYRMLICLRRNDMETCRGGQET